MEKITLGILITSAVGGAILGIKKTNAEIKTLKESSVDVNKKIAKMQEASLANFKKMSVTAAITGMGIKRLVEPAIEFESAMADVKKVVDFDTPQQFEQMQKDILGLTRSLPLAGEELAQIAASGGQLGVAKQDITTFTTTIAKMATAFDMSAEDSGDAMAKLANVYQIPIKEIGKLGDAINHLSNNSPAKASDIVSTLGRVGGVAKAFGLTSNQAASLANSFISLGKTPEIAATAINSMLTTMSVAEKAPAKVQKALEDLGLSASHLKANIAKDGEGAIVDLLKRVNSMPKDMQTGILVDIFGREFADDVAVLAGGIDNYQKSINMLNSTNKAGKLDYLGSMEKEFNARAATTENNIQLLKNSMKEIGVVLGNTLLPILNDVVFGLKGLVNIISDFAKNNPTLTSGLIQATLAVLYLSEFTLLSNSSVRNSASVRVLYLSEFTLLSNVINAVKRVKKVLYLSEFTLLSNKYINGSDLFSVLYLSEFTLLSNKNFCNYFLCKVLYLSEFTLLSNNSRRI